MKMKTVPADDRIQDARGDLLAVLRNHATKLTSEEILALLSQLVGQTIAYQNQRVITPSMAMEIVSHNIEAGNHQALAQINDKPMGNA